MIVNKYQGNGGGGGGSYVLPAATANRLGGIKVGDGLSVTPDGTLSSSASDFNKLMAVSELPESAETGDVVALSSETGETITFNVSDVVFGEGEDILEISGDGLHTLTVNAFHDAENQVNVLKLTNSLNEEYLVEDGSSAMLPASTNDELIWTWKADLNNGVVTIKLYDDDNEAYLPLSTSNISLNVCDAKVNGTFVGVYQYEGQQVDTYSGIVITVDWKTISTEAAGTDDYLSVYGSEFIISFAGEELHDGKNTMTYDGAMSEYGHFKSVFTDSNMEVWLKFDSNYAYIVISDPEAKYSIEVAGKSGALDSDYTKYASERVGSIEDYGPKEYGRFVKEAEMDAAIQEAMSGVDSHILKASSGTPENLSAGDVYATYKEAKDAQIGDTWVDGIGMNPSWNRYYDGSQPQAIRVGVREGTMSSDIFNIRYACNDYDTGETVRIDEAGKLSMNTDVWTEVSANHWVLSDAAWVPSRTDGNVLYADYDGTNVYIYSTNVEKIWIMGVENNSTGKNVYAGEVTPPSDAECKVFQAGIKSVPNVKIELEGNARIDGTLDDPEQVVTMSDGQMKISFYDPSIVMGNVCDLESYGTYFHLDYDGSNDSWTLFDSDEESSLIKIGDGESGSADFGDGNVYLSFSGGVLTAYTDYDKGWQNWDMGGAHEVIAAQELAKVSDLPSNTRLLPANPNNGDMVVYSETAWTTSSRDSVFVDGLRAFQNNWSDDGGKYVITRTDYWNLKWEKLDFSELEAVSAMPATAKDGNVYALSTSGYGIVQSQGYSSATTWVPVTDSSLTGWTKFRAPYEGDGGITEIHVDGTVFNLWYRYDNGNPHFDGDAIDLSGQVNGEFSTTIGDNNTTVTSVKDGNYMVVTIGRPVEFFEGYDANPEIEMPMPVYANVVMSEDVTKIKKMTQTAYDALAVKDPETMYIIIG